MTDNAEYKPFTIRTIKAVKNPEWADEEHKVLRAEVLFEELEDQFGFVAFSTIENADTDHGLEVWQNAISGDYGAIAEFIPPTIEQVRASMSNLTARQFRLGLLSLGKLEAVPAAIAKLPQPEKSQAEIEWNFATEFRRLHPLITQLVPILGMTDEQVDAVWLEYSQI